MAMFDDIIEQCETNPDLVKIENDNNPDTVISDQDIELLSKYLEDEPMME